jgi:hypothetical protein
MGLPILLLRGNIRNLLILLLAEMKGNIRNLFILL